MDFRELSKIIKGEIKPKLENNPGLYIFARERAKFEGWLKVELCASLSKYFDDVTPEKSRIDVTFDNWAIQLKTANTNIRYEDVENKHRPITKNTEGIIKDVKNLESVGYANKAMLFVVFPIEHDNQNWQNQLQRISPLVREIEYFAFSFNHRIPGVLYFCLI